MTYKLGITIGRNTWRSQTIHPKIMAARQTETFLIMFSKAIMSHKTVYCRSVLFKRLFVKKSKKWNRVIKKWMKMKWNVAHVPIFVVNTFFHSMALCHTLHCSCCRLQQKLLCVKWPVMQNFSFTTDLVLWFAGVNCSSQYWRFYSMHRYTVYSTSWYISLAVHAFPVMEQPKQSIHFLI